MKYLALISALFLMNHSLNAQNDSLVNNRYTLKSQYLLNRFFEGEVVLKNGLKINKNLNYNTFTEEIYYFQNNQLFEIGNKVDIESINIYNFKFCYINNKYFIELYKNKNLQILRKITILEKNDKRVGSYGVNTETTAVSKVNVLDKGYLGSLQVNIVDENEPEYKVMNDYFIFYDNKIYDLKSKYIKKIFSDKFEKIEVFIKENNIELNKETDIVKLFDFILSN